MPLVPLIVAAKNAADLIKLARKTLEHYRALPSDEQERLRGEADHVRVLTTELGAAKSQSVRGRVGKLATSDRELGRDSKVIAADLRDALARFADSAAQEVAAVAKGESRKMRYAAKAVGFGARRLDRGVPVSRSGVDGPNIAIGRGDTEDPNGAVVALEFEAKGLITWAETVFRDAGVASADEQVREMAATAASLIIRLCYLPFAAEHPVPEFVDYVEGHPMTADERLEHFDEIRRSLLHMTTTVELARSGEDKRMYNPNYNRVLKLVEAMDSDFQETQRPIWTEDIRLEYAVAGGTAAPPAKKRRFGWS